MAMSIFDKRIFCHVKTITFFLILVFSISEVFAVAPEAGKNARRGHDFSHFDRIKPYAVREVEREENDTILSYFEKLIFPLKLNLSQLRVRIGVMSPEDVDMLEWRYQDKIRANPANLAIYYKLAEVYIMMDRNKDAVHVLKSALERRPDSPYPHILLATAYCNMRQWEESLALAEMTIKNSAKESWAVANCYLLRGFAHLMLNHWPDAARDFSEAVRRQPDFAMAHLGRGVAYVLLENRPGAWKEYEVVSQIRPDFAQILYEMLHFKRANRSDLYIR